MNGWKSTLRADPIGWLLEKDNPSVRYFTLTDILEKPGSAPEVREAKAQIMGSGIVPKILTKQTEEGYWGVREDFYVKAKYRGTVWQIIILAELGASGEDEHIQKAAEFILRNSQDRTSGGFAYRGGESRGGQHGAMIPCLTGNMVWSLIRFGYLEDSRVQQGINWITRYQRFDDGIEEKPAGWPYDKKDVCWGTHTCHMGAVKALKTLSAIPPNKRSDEVKNTIEKGADYLLQHHIHKRSHDLTKVAKPGWLQFGFPLMWKTDALDMLQVLINLGYRDQRMQEAVDLVKSKQDSQGQWNLETTFNGRMLVNVEQQGKPSKWITLNALRVLKEFL